MSRSRSRLDLESIRRLTELADYAVPFAVRVVANLGVADHLDKPRPVGELAEATGSDSDALYRVLRVLAGKGIFHEDPSGWFGPSPLSELLRTDHPMSLRGLCYLMPHDIRAWAAFEHTVRTGESAFDHVHGQDYWTYLAGHPDQGARFDESQQSATRLELLTAVRVYDWASLTTIADLGGGNGAFLAGLLSRYPHLRGVLVDLPHVVAHAPPVLAAAGVDDRCDIIPADFFTIPPPTADAYILARCLYGWDDDHVIRLLRSIRTAMTPDSRLLIVEPLADLDEAATVTVDLWMAVLSPGRVREPSQIKALLGEVGLDIHRLYRTFPFPIIDARPLSAESHHGAV